MSEPKFGEWQPITALRTTEQFVLVGASGMLPAVALLHARRDVNGHELFKQPTHWMALPEPPAVVKLERNQ